MKHLLAIVLVPAVLLTTSGCGDETTSPSTAESREALAATATTPVSFRQITASGHSGPGHACGVTTDDVAYCRGSNLWGELGIGQNSGPEDCNTHPCSTRPARVLGGLHFRHLSAGVGFTCGITTEFKAYCWGRNFEGALGDGTQRLRTKPVPVAADASSVKPGRVTATPAPSPRLRRTSPSAGDRMLTASWAMARPHSGSPRCEWPAASSGSS